jgi:hypothetical protein
VSDPVDRASDVDQPDGGAESREQEGTGRTPHPEQPAEGDEAAGGQGADTPSA